MRLAVKVGFVFLASWVTGLVAYLAALAVLFGELISLGDLRWVLFLSLVAFAIAFFAVYLPALSGIRSLLHGVRPFWPFPVVGGLLGVVPITLVAFLGGVGFVSPEASLFYVMFVAAGLVAGFGLARLCWYHHAV